jgi:NadR type nicotinamide-nucleotide adenylyltransferase
MEDIRRIVVIGPESTGKSTLSVALAAQYRTLWVPEYARAFLEEQDGAYTEADLLTIAQGQVQAEDEAAAHANGVLIADTDLYVLKVWSEHRYGRCDRWILDQIARRKYDLYLLTYIDIPWQDDPLREHPEPEMRHYFYEVYKDIVQNSGVRWAEVRGTLDERMLTATSAIDRMLYQNF